MFSLPMSKVSEIKILMGNCLFCLHNTNLGWGLGSYGFSSTGKAQHYCSEQQDRWHNKYVMQELENRLS